MPSTRHFLPRDAL